MSNLSKAALWYAQHLQWHVFPCKPLDKTPLVEDWPHKATTDPRIISTWWTQWPDANIGIATGSSRLVVIDVDVKNGAQGQESWALLLAEHGRALSATVSSETPSGGEHYLFRSTGARIRNSASKLGPGLDVRAEGGYIVAPPSLTREGAYAWAMNSNPAELAVAALPISLEQTLSENGHKAATPLTPQKTEGIPEGSRNQAMASIAGLLRARGLSPEALYAVLQIENERCHPPLDDEELRKIAESIGRYAPDQDYSRSDYGNARRFVDQHGAKVRFCHGRGRWLVWDERRWQQDASAEVIRMAKETVRGMYAELGGIEEKDARREMFKFILRSEADAKIASMLSSAESEIEAAITQLQLDTDAWLFNCENGTLNLRTGELAPHRQEDLITTLAPVRYDPRAKSTLWERFLQESTGDDQDLIAFLARAVGYTLTGDTREENLFFVHGPTNTGKSTFLEAIKALLGDYAMTAEFETFLSRSFVGGPRPDIARLAGARFVVSIEVDEGKKLAEGLVKQLTGGDTINARFLYQESFDFLPQFKLWLAANHAPDVGHADDAIWRRILRVPFEVTVPKEKRDPAVKERLRNDPAERAAILAWAVQGCLDWQRNGLGVPQRVEQATEEYRRSQDPLRDFLEAYCVLSENIWTPAEDLRQVYEKWAKETGAEMLRGAKWSEALKTHGCQSDRQYRGSVQMRGWRGIGLVVDYEDGVPTQSQMEQKDDLPF